MKAERENCCDDLAVAACGNRQVYAGALAMLAELQLPVLSAPAASGWKLLPRIRRIVGGGLDHAPRRASWLPPLLVLAVLAAVGAFMLLGGARAGDAKAAPGKEAATQDADPAPPKTSAVAAGPPQARSSPVPLSAEQRAEIARRIADVLDKAVAEHAEDAAAFAKLPLEARIPERDANYGGHEFMYLPPAIQLVACSPGDARYNAVCVQTLAKCLDDKRPQYRAAACELLRHSFPYETVEEGLLSRIARLLDDSAPTFPMWESTPSPSQRGGSISRLRGGYCVSDAARATLGVATGFGFADSKTFDVWWQGNSDTHRHLWYWSIRWQWPREKSVESDLPALVDAMGPEGALKTLLLVGFPINTAIEAEMLTLYRQSGGSADNPPKVGQRIAVFSASNGAMVPLGVTPEAVAKLVRDQSLKPRLLEVLRQERPWPELKTDESTQVNLAAEVIDVVRIVATKDDFPAIQSALENPTPVLKSRSDLSGRLSAILAALDPQRATEVLLAEFRRDPEHAAVAAQIIRTSRLEHWDAIAPFIQDRHLRRQIVAPVGEVRTKQAAAILAGLLAGENLITDDRGSVAQDAWQLLGDYVKAATFLNDDHPLVGEDLLRRADGRMPKQSGMMNVEQMWEETLAARAEVIERLKRFFAARAAGPEHRPAQTPVAPAAPPVASTPGYYPGSAGVGRAYYSPPAPLVPSAATDAISPAAGAAYPPYNPAPPVAPVPSAPPVASPPPYYDPAPPAIAVPPAASGQPGAPVAPPNPIGPSIRFATDGQRAALGAPRTLTVSEVIDLVSQTPLPTMPNFGGFGSAVCTRMDELHRQGVFTPRADDRPALLKAMNDPSSDLPARLCAAGFLLDLDDQAARTFCLSHLDRDDPISIGEAAYTLLRHLRADDREDWAAAQIVHSIENDHLFKATWSEDVLDRVGGHNLKAAEPALIAALKRWPDSRSLACAVGNFATERARAALLETVEGPNGIRLTQAIRLAELKAPGLPEVLLRHLDDEDAADPAGLTVPSADRINYGGRIHSLLGDLGDAKALPGLRSYLAKHPAGVNARETRISIARLEAQDPKDLAERLGAMLDDPANAEMAGRIIHELGKTKDPGMVAPLLRIMKKSNEEGVLMDGTFALEEVDGPQGLLALVELLDRDYVGEPLDKPGFQPFVLRDWIARALENKTGQHFGADKQKWQEYLAHLPLGGPLPQPSPGPR
jgi:hypothetical protein